MPRRRTACRRTATRLAALLAFTGLAAAAQEERAIDNFSGLGVRAMGMGGAYSGVADDFTAVFWNPAGLAQIQKRQVYVAFLRNARKDRATLGQATATASVNNTRFGSLGFVYPFPVYQGSFVLAAGFNRVKDFDWALRTAGVVDSLTAQDSFRHEGELAITTVAAAADVAPSVSLGLALSLIGGQDEAVNEFISTDTQGYFLEHRFVDREVFLDDYLTTWTANLGVMLRVPRQDPRLRVGAAIATGPTHKVRYTFRAPPDTAFTSIEYDDGRVITEPSADFRDSYRIALPLAFGAGVSFRPVKRLLLAGAVDATEWSQTEYRDRDENELRANTSFETQYDDPVRWHLGAEWQVPWLALDLRGGYYSDPVAFVGPRDPDRAADEADNPRVRSLRDRRFWTLGAGLLLEEAVQADLAYTRGSYRQAEGRGESQLREDVHIDRFFVGVSYQF